MGESEPIEFLFELFLLRTRASIQKARVHVEAIAKKPRMTMTAMAQCGKEEDEEVLLCTPTGDGVAEAREAASSDEREEAEAAEAAEREEAEAEAAEAREEEVDIAATTESANVVWTALNTANVDSVPSKGLSLLCTTQKKGFEMFLPSNWSASGPNQVSFTGVA